MAKSSMATETRSAEAPRRPPMTVTGLLMVALLVCVAGLRWRVGVDFDQYAYSYENEYRLLHLSDLSVWQEPGIRLIAIAAARFHDDAATMFFIAALVTVGLTVVTIYRNARSLPLAIALYIVTSTWQGSFNGVRQYLACAVVFAGHRLILQRRLRAYAAVVGVAFLFHVSAVVLILLYWVPRRRLPVATVVVLVVAALLSVNLYPYFAEFVDSIRGAGYTEHAYFTERVSILRVLAALGPALVYLLLTDRQVLSERGHFYGNIMIIHAATFVSAAQSAYVARLTLYTAVFIALAVPELLNMRSARINSVVAMFALALYSVFWYLETSGVSALANFQWVFSRSIG